MNTVELNWVSIAIATVVNVVIGAMWFNAPFLFAQMWLDGIGKSAEQVAAQATPLKPLSALIGAVITSVLLSAIISWSGATTVINGALIGLMVAIGFLAVMTGVKDYFEGRPLKLYLINAGHDIVVLVLMGAIIAGIR